MNKLKICKKCGKEKLATLEFFHYHAETIDKLRQPCKECRSQRKEKYINGLKPCSKCGQYKIPSNDNFFNSKESKDGLSYSCKECDKKRNLLEKRKQQRKRICQKYRNTPKGRFREKFNKHKRRTLEKETDITPEWLEELRKISISCPLCNHEMNDIQYNPHSRHLDHIVGVYIGGKTIKSNVRYICQICNLSRSKDCSDLKIKNMMENYTGRVFEIKKEGTE